MKELFNIATICRGHEMEGGSKPLETGFYQWQKPKLFLFETFKENM